MGRQGRENAILKLKTRTGLYDSFRFEYRCVGNISSTTCPTAHDSFVLSGINIVNDEIESGMGMYETELSYSNINNNPQFKISRITKRWDSLPTEEPAEPIIITKIVGII